MYRFLHQVVHRRTARENHTCPQHRLRAHHRALVHAAIPADDHIVLDNDWRGVNGFEHTADLCRRAEMHPLADLRTRADEGVRIDHRAATDIRPDIDVHGRHADDVRREIRTASYRGPARHDAHLMLHTELARGECVLIEKMKRCLPRHFHDPADTKAEQNCALYPRHGVPRAVRITTGGANLAALEQRQRVIK